jgi:hypothetical protein
VNSFLGVASLMQNHWKEVSKIYYCPMGTNNKYEWIYLKYHLGKPYRKEVIIRRNLYCEQARKKMKKLKSWVCIV